MTNSIWNLPGHKQTNKYYTLQRNIEEVVWQCIDKHLLEWRKGNEDYQRRLTKKNDCKKIHGLSLLDFSEWSRSGSLKQCSQAPLDLISLL